MQSLAEELYQRVTTRDDSRPKNYGDLPRPQENANFWFVGDPHLTGLLKGCPQIHEFPLRATLE